MSDEIQPFRIDIPQADLEYLHNRSPTPAGRASCPAWPGLAASRWTI
jgi:hypothetical protein